MRFIVFTLFMALCTIMQAQQSAPHRCNATEIHNHHYATDMDYRHAYDVNKIELDVIKAASAGQVRLDCTSPIIIPVAVHYEGVTSQTAACLEALALSQIAVLNADFSASNPDIANYCNDVDNGSLDPNALAANGACIQFCLATQNHPAGFGLSNGNYAITIGQNYVANNTFPNFTLGVWSGYLNIFVTEGTGVLGYAPLFGAANGDGVVIEACAFGVQGSGCGNGIGPGAGCTNLGVYNLGRTTTHEVGHYLGLNHIWGPGDGTLDNCGQDDGFADTPTSQGQYFGCPTTFPSSCGSGDMYMNYMDYVNDACMYMFSEDQATLMYNSADTHWGTTSTKCSPVPTYPVATLPAGCDPAANDAGIIAHITPTPNSSTCAVGTLVTPVVTIQNIGATTLTSATIFYEINSVVIGTQNWTGSLVTGATENVTFLVAYPEPAGIYEFKSYTSNPNGIADDQPNNDEFASNHQTVVTQSIPYQEDFEDGSFNPTNSGLSVINPDGDAFAWTQAGVSANGTGNFSATFDNFSGTQSANPGGTNDAIATPVFDFSGVTGAELTFDVAYAIYNTNIFDSLVVSISTDCGNTYNQTVFLDGNTGLATTSANTSPFTPTSTQWNNITVDLSQFDGTPNLSVAFINFSGWGNNMYIDNINISSPTPQNCTVAAISTGVSCSGNDGTATATASNTTGTVSYVWSNGATDANIGNLAPNTYTVTITDTGGCTNTTTVTVDDDCNCGNFQVLSNTANNVSCFGGCDGIAVAQATGGDNNYSYNWSNGFTQATQTGLCAGTYTVTVSDSGGCSGTTIVTITEPTLLNASITVLDNVSCFGGNDGVATAAESGGSGGYTYLWNTGITTETHTGLSAGTYTVTVTDGNGCFATSMVTVTESAEISLTTTSTGETCVGNDGSALATAAGNLTYLWSNGMTAPLISNLSAGNYTVTVTDISSQCTVSEILTVPDNCNCGNFLASSSIVNNASCFGDCSATITAQATGGDNNYSYNWSNGFTQATQTGLCAGTYTITVSDSGGCSGTTTVTITEPAELTLTTASTPETCTGNDGTASVTATGNVTYLWSNGMIGVSISNLTAGTYTVVATDFATQCTASEIVTVANNCNCGNFLASSTIVNNVTCFGDCDGIAVAQATGGDNNYSYSWSNGFTQATQTGLCAGTYTVTVSDSNGCSGTATTTITESAPINITISSDASCNGVCSGNLEAIATGGTAGTSGYDFQWSNGSIGSTQTNLCSGDYTVTVTDAVGCTATAIATVLESAAISLTTTSTGETCAGNDGSALATAAGNATYLWSNGMTDPLISNLSAGNYTVTVTDLSSQCTVSETLTVTDNCNCANFLVSSTILNNISCFGECDGTAIAQATGGDNNYSYAWADGPTQATRTGLCPGIYTVTVSDTNGCSGITTVTITEPAPITLTTASTSETCTGNDGTATVTGGGNATYVWSNGMTGASISNLTAGNYTVVATDISTQCTASEMVTVTNDCNCGNFLALSDIVNNISCFGDCSATVVTQATGGNNNYSYIWSNGFTQATQTGLCADTYTITISDTNGCSGTTTVTIIEPTPITLATASTPETCIGNDGTATVTGGGNATYVWSNGITGASISNLAAGTYTVVATDFATQCTASETVVVTNTCNCDGTLAYNGSISNAGCQGDCNGAITGSATGGNGGYSYEWSTGEITASISGLCAGTYMVTVYDANQCSYIETYTINENPAVTFSTITTPETCIGSDGTATAIGTGNIIHSWSTGETGSTITGLSAGVYIVTGTDINTGCTSEQTFTITEDCACNLTISAVSTAASCSGQCDGTATATSNGGNATYQWSNGATGSTVSNLCAGTYTITASDGNNCTTTGSITITEPNPMILDVIGNDANCGPQSGSVSTVITGGTAPITYIWSTGNTTSAINGLSGGNYQVTATDINGCTQTGLVTLNELSLLSITGNITNATCGGDTDGAVDVTITGGVPPFTYDWSNGETTEDLNNLPAGNYVLIVTDANNCSSGTSFNVGQPDPIIINMTIVDANNGSNGSIVAGTSGGNAPYIWQWSDGSTSLLNSNLSAGDYTVVVTDANGCSASATATVTNTTNTFDPSLVTEWSIHPNPSNGLFFLSMELAQTEKISVRVVNMIGQTIFESQYNDSSLEQKLDLQQFAQGTYLLEIKVKESRVIEKLMIVR